jgi:LysR family transcriptional regulator, hydrogen peroxide-inducible genes activator
MTLTELRYIVAVARERHFGRAAEKCFVSQPTLSVSVRNLEDELGITLFERTRTEVLVTDIGREVVAQAERVLAEVDRVRSLAQQGRDPLQGPLRLGVIHTIAPYVLPELVVALHKAAPGMPLDVEENQTYKLEEMLRAGSIDAAILALPFNVPGIGTGALYEEAFKVVLPAGHRWARRRSIAPAELHEENVLLLSMGHCFRDQVLDACSEISLPATAGRQGNSLETLRSMVVSGLGISVLPACALTRRYESPLLKVVPFTEPVPTRRVALAWRQGFHRPAALDVVAAAVRALSLPVRMLEAVA